MIWPSKRVLSAFIVIAALVVSIIIAFGRDKSSRAINYASNLVVGEKITIPENPNWQNELSGVVQNIEPIQLDQASTSSTVTDAISQSLMANYMALKQSGTLNSTSTQQLVDQTASYINAASAQITPVTQAQLSVIADNGLQSMANYGEALGNIFKSNKPVSAKNELTIINQALVSKDSSGIGELDSIISVYEITARELVTVPVPKTFVKAHLDIVNGLSGVAGALKEAKNIFSDPVRGLKGLQLYQESAMMTIRALAATIDFLKQNNIVYKQDSGGYYLFYGL